MALRAGLHLEPTKCKLYWPTPPPPHVCSRYLPAVLPFVSEGIEILGVQVGTAPYERAIFQKTGGKVMRVHKQLRRMTNRHCDYHLLRICLSACKVNYVLRMTLPRNTLPACRRIDEHTFENIRLLAGGAFSIEFCEELSLPLRMPNIGIGASANCMAVVCDTMELVRTLLESRASMKTLWKTQTCGQNTLTGLTAR